MSTAEGKLAETISAIERDARMSEGIAFMSTRRGEFPSTRAMQLAGIAVVPEARRYLDSALTESWNRGAEQLARTTYDEVVIGSGVHAAIYCATRVRQGFNTPLVLERDARVGGTFAMSDAPSFYLNSGNRPGLVGLPNRGQALNVVPGAEVQPADISLREYQTNADVGFVVRTALARFANVVTGVNVLGYGADGRDSDYGVALDLGGLGQIRAARVIDARGLGDANRLDNGKRSDPDRVLTFPEFARRFDRPFPLRGLNRVAVIGNGDSAKTTVEALLGIGPSSGMSTAGLDYVQSITWYGNGIPADCESWLRDERKRYARIGAYLGTGRLNVVQGQGTVAAGMDSVLVNGQSYDLAVTAVGYNRPMILTDGGGWRMYGDEDYPLARKAITGEIYRVGPAANLSFTGAELTAQRGGYVTRPANGVSIFRLAPRTSALAATLAPKFA